MFERFTDRARKVMSLANQECQRFNHEHIGTEHILLGLVKEGCGCGAKALLNLGIDLRRVRLEIEKLVKCGSDMVVMGKIPQSPRAKKAIENAIVASREDGLNYVGTEHVLIGLLKDPDSVACQVLMNLGVSIDNLKAEVSNLLVPRITETDDRLPTVGRHKFVYTMIVKSFSDNHRFLEFLNEQGSLGREVIHVEKRRDSLSDVQILFKIET